MKKNYIVEKMGKTRTRYTFTEKNGKNESICFDLSRIESDGKKGSLPYLWKKAGYIDRILKSRWILEVFCTEEDGSCWGRYNPQIIPGTNKINFDWMLEATEENRQKLIDEVYRLAFIAA